MNPAIRCRDIGISSAPEVISKENEKEPDIKHDCPGPGKAEVDSAQPFQVLDEDKDESDCETEEAYL